jgi:hypothetical protein
MILQEHVQFAFLGAHCAAQYADTTDSGMMAAMQERP